MKKYEYSKYIEAEAVRQWNENQSEKYGIWDKQTEDTKTEYYNELYIMYSDMITA